MFQNIGEMLVLFWRTLLALPQAWRQRQKVFEQFFEIANASLLMVCILSFFIGAVIALQTGPVLVERGLAIVLATDFNPGTSPIASMPLVLSLACLNMALTPAEALTAATINAAWSLDLGHCSGSLESGKQADLLIHEFADYRDYAEGDDLRHLDWNVLARLDAPVMRIRLRRISRVDRLLIAERGGGEVPGGNAVRQKAEAHDHGGGFLYSRPQPEID